jgi:HEAT repeat protein
MMVKYEHGAAQSYRNILVFGPSPCHISVMRKRFRIVLLVLLLGGVGLVLWEIQHARQPKEPVYQGKALSVWLDDYWIESHGDSAESLLMAKTNHEVDEVVRRIGTNAIPILFRMLNATDSPLRKLQYLARDRGWYDFKFKSAPAQAQNIQAAMAFGALGAEAKDAVPELIEMCARKHHEDTRGLVALALGGIGPPASNAVPLLLRTVTNAAPFGAFYNAFRALGKIHAEPEQVVPLMIKFLKDPDVNIRMYSIINLEAFGADARPAVPALVEALTDQVDYIRKRAAQALKVIDPDTAAKAGVK